MKKSQTKGAKGAAHITPELVTAQLLQRWNPLRSITPSRFVRALEDYDAGRVADLCRIMDAYERRDDAFRANSRKAYASVARCQHAVNIVEGYEDDADAAIHKETLEKFWVTVRVTSAFQRNETGSLRLLQRQMAGAVSHGHAIHEITWQPSADGTLRATFTFVPPWMFETTTGAARFLPTPASIEGEEMAPGEWLVTTGDGIGIAASICAMSKRLSLNDWLAFCERCGQPGLHGKSSAQYGSPEWKNFVSSLRSFGRDWAIATGLEESVEAVNLNVSAPPWPALVDMCDRAIAALWRGCDLATVSSQPDGPGASVQKDEKNILEEDFCEAISEALHDQVSRHVIAWHFGEGTEPLAYLQIRPTTQPNTDADIKIDQHLVSLGVPLSGTAALARYQRETVKDGDANDFPLKPPAQTQLPSPPAPPRPFANELPALEDETLAEAAYEAIALEALTAARANGLEGIQDALLAALESPDEETLKAKLSEIYASLPKLFENPDPATENLMQRILLGAMEQNPVAKRREAPKERKEGN